MLFQGADLSGVDRIFLEMHDHVTGLSGVRGLFATLAGHGFVYDPRHSLGSVVLFQKLGAHRYRAALRGVAPRGGRHDRGSPASAARSAGASTGCRKEPRPATAPPAAATERSGPMTTRASGSGCRARPAPTPAAAASSSISAPTAAASPSGAARGSTPGPPADRRQPAARRAGGGRRHPHRPFRRARQLRGPAARRQVRRGHVVLGRICSLHRPRERAYMRPISGGSSRRSSTGTRERAAGPFFASGAPLDRPDRQSRHRPPPRRDRRARGRGHGLRAGAAAADGRQAGGAADHGRAARGRHRDRGLRQDQPGGGGGARRRGPDQRRVHARGVEPRHRPAADPAQGLRSATRATRRGSRPPRRSTAAGASRASSPGCRTARC